MSDLAAFLLERLAEDEAAFRAAGHDWAEIEQYMIRQPHGPVTFTEERALADCAAKRAVIGLYVDAAARLDDPGPVDPDAVEVVEARDQGAEAALEDALLALAAPYAAHPAFDPSWGVPEQNKEQRP